MKTDHDFLFKLLAQPTAPYRESHVMGVLMDYLIEKKVSFFFDPIGNLVLGVKNQKEYAARLKVKSKDPVRVFMAHTDHPGFHGVAWENDRVLAFKWHGGSPKKHLEGASVWLATAAGTHSEGKIKTVTLNTAGTAIVSGTLETKGIFSKVKPKELFGGFSFRSPIWQEEELLYTKAADDLIGCFAITTLAVARKKDKSFIGLLTRAEEVGFIGAIGHFELGWLQKATREVLCISLETSRTLPGAEIGKGPIVRLGDRMTVFDPAGVNLLWDLAKKTLKTDFQRRIMDGGACEASASTAYGIRSIGISVPLGNYHNQSLQGGPDSRGEDGPAPEYVHRKDLEGMLKLCESLLTSKLNFDDPWKARRQGFSKSLKSARALLSSA